MTKNIFIISAASGTGKTSLVDALLKEIKDVKLSISHTTRKPRANEADGVNYYFVTDAEFQRLIFSNQMLEYANIFGNLYGTSKKNIDETIKNHDIILELDWQGAAAVKKIYSDAISIFILPPSKKVLRERIINRNQDDKDVIEKRLQAAADEISHYKNYDYLIVNDSFKDTVEILKNILLVAKYKTKINAPKLDKLLHELIF